MSIADSCCCCNTDVRKAVPKTPLCIWCEFGSFRQTSHCFNVLIQSISLWLVGSVVEIYCPNFSFNPNWLTTQPELNYFGIRGFFICEETALEVLMYQAILRSIFKLQIKEIHSKGSLEYTGTGGGQLLMSRIAVNEDIVLATCQDKYSE